MKYLKRFNENNWDDANIGDGYGYTLSLAEQDIILMPYYELAEGSNFTDVSEIKTISDIHGEKYRGFTFTDPTNGKIEIAFNIGSSSDDDVSLTFEDGESITILPEDINDILNLR